MRFFVYNHERKITKTEQLDNDAFEKRVLLSNNLASLTVSIGSNGERRRHSIFLGKTAHDPASEATRDDEEEGSPLRDGVNPATTECFLMVAGENRKISGSPPGAPLPDHLSLRKNFATMPRQQWFGQSRKGW